MHWGDGGLSIRDSSADRGRRETYPPAIPQQNDERVVTRPAFSATGVGAVPNCFVAQKRGGAKNSKIFYTKRGSSAATLSPPFVVPVIWMQSVLYKKLVALCLIVGTT